MAFTKMLVTANFLESHMSIEMSRDDTVCITACSHVEYQRYKKESQSNAITW